MGIRPAEGGIAASPTAKAWPSGNPVWVHSISLVTSSGFSVPGLEVLQLGRAAFEKSLGPLYARLSALGSESGTPPELTAQGMAIIKQINAAYEKACPEWWGATGHFHAWLKKYKDHLVNNRIPHRERGEAMKMTQFKIMGVPADAFRPTVAMETVVLYMNEALAIFERRESNRKTSPMIPK